MTKLQFTLRPPADGPAALASFLERALVPALLRGPPARIKLTATDPRPPRLAVIPFARDPLALISLWPAPGEPLSPGPWIELLGPLGRELAGYRVEESTPVAPPRAGADGVPTPGIGLMTLFRRRAGLSDEAFIARWHGGHTPLSLEIHPLRGYIRNVVAEAVVPGSPAHEGIVEEHFRSPADLLRPWRFFGGPARMLPNMARVARDVAGFIEMKTLRTYLAQELWLRGG